ncbi:uncharacterized protein N7473_007430 [Penicillium subrubescens]|uniref:uncharacterized protein n=1 Tax=Penicillium subrubescens TaxID=1316194 RepID=UPI002545938C|nr:uncharacterized protein N7473_007430 [Penicillium subrubescens]KAJ5891202.1 hypothetical protein N7473_007430 [Penicillium subrubescens]
MPPTKDLNLPFSDNIKYTASEVDRMEGNCGLLDGALNLQKVKVLHDLNGDPANSRAQALIDG